MIPWGALRSCSQGRNTGFEPAVTCAPNIRSWRSAIARTTNCVSSADTISALPPRVPSGRRRGWATSGEFGLKCAHAPIRTCIEVLAPTLIAPCAGIEVSRCVPADTQGQCRMRPDCPGSVIGRYVDQLGVGANTSHV